MYKSKLSQKKREETDNASTTALTAVAFQDHLLRSFGTLSLSNPLGTRKLPSHKPKDYKKEAKSVINTGLNRAPAHKKPVDGNKEYVLDPKPPAPTLAQKLGLVEKPKALLSEDEWSDVKIQSNNRDDSDDPCVICKEEFGNQQQVLLSCSHVFHRSCLEAFERFSGKKTCPMCRREQYQTRVIHEGARVYRHKCATLIQAQWRGYVVRCWYKKLRETVPPKDPALRQKFYEDKLTSITERMIRSIDFDTNAFLREIDNNLEASRDVFRNFDHMRRYISEEEWEEIQLKAVERGETECPICLTELERGGITSRLPKHTSETPHQYRPQQYNPNSRQSNKQAQNSQRLPPITKNQKPKLLPKSITHGGSRRHNGNVNTTVNGKAMGEGDSVGGACGTISDKSNNDSRDELIRQKVLLSCSHLFHATCLQAFEELAEGERRFTCPICRSNYHKKII